MENFPDKRNVPLRPPPMETSMIAPVPKKARYAERPMPRAPSWNQPLRIDTSLDSNKIKVGDEICTYFNQVVVLLLIKLKCLLVGVRLLCSKAASQ